MDTKSLPSSQVLQIMVCGPSDTEPYTPVVFDVGDEWNRIHSEALGQYLRVTHWKSHATPDLSQRAQGVINEQLHDHADLIVAILWNRFGDPTGVAESGTEEEIRCAISTKKRVLLYFCLAEDMRLADLEQAARVNRFRGEMKEGGGLFWTFRSREEFEKLLREHLGRAVHQINATRPKAKPKRDSVRRQSIKGNNNIQIGDNHGTVQQFASPPRITKVVERNPEWITPQEAKQIQEWIHGLADLTTDCSVGDAHRRLWSKLGKKFRVSTYKELRSSQMPEVEGWYVFNKTLLKKGQKHTDPEQWRADATRMLKSAMWSMGRTKADYYPELARRLKIKPFTSSRHLTKANLERGARMAYRDSRSG